MPRCSRALCALTIVLACACASAQTAQHYPAKPIRMLSAQFGGGSDIAARLIAGALSPRLGQQVVVDPFRDFAPVTLIGSAPMVVVVHPSVPAKSIAELIALAKAKPGELNSATGPLGATPHLASELLKESVPR